MRDYGNIPARLLLTLTKVLKARYGSVSLHSQVLGPYLLCCPSSNMIGLYYAPQPTIAHELAWAVSDVEHAFEQLGEVNFAFYDAEQEIVFVPEMAACQIAPELHPKDKRVKYILRELERCKDSRFCAAFLDRYARPFHLVSPDGNKPLARDTEGTSKEHLSRSDGDKPSIPQKQNQSHDRNSIRVMTEAASSSAASAAPSVSEDDILFRELRSKVRGEIELQWNTRNEGITVPWDAKAAKNLNAVLKANLGWTFDSFARCIRHRFQSERNHSEAPFKWLPHLTDYLSAPLDRFGQPIGPKANGRTNGFHDDGNNAKYWEGADVILDNSEF
jgi:hypothetical protein